MSLLLALTAGGATPVNYALTCSAGSYTYTGIAASLKVVRSLACSAGSYSYTGVEASLKVEHSLVCSAGAYAYTGIAATLTYVSGAVSKHGGDDAPWRKEKKRKKKDEYAEATIARKQSVIAAYKGLLEPETPEIVAIEAKTVVQSAELDALDLAKVQKLLALWQAELDRRDEQDDEEALLMLL